MHIPPIPDYQLNALQAQASLAEAREHLFRGDILGEDERVGAPKAGAGFGVELAADEMELVGERAERRRKRGGGCGSAGDEMQGLIEAAVGDRSIRAPAVSDGMGGRASGCPDDGERREGARDGGVVDRENTMRGRDEAVVPDLVSDFPGEGE